MRSEASKVSMRLRGTAMLLVLLMLSPAVSVALSRGERHEWRNELFQMEDSWRTALLRGNAQAMSGLLADDYMAITANGMLESKEQTLLHMRNGVMRFRSIEVTDRKVRFYGSTAVVTSRAEVVGTTVEGDISGGYRYTHVWVQEGKGPWRIVSFEASRIREPRGQR